MPFSPSRNPWGAIVIAALLAFILFTWLTATYDLAPVCPDGLSTVGFSHLNVSFRDATASLHTGCRAVSKLLGGLALATAAAYALYGAAQLMRRRNPAAVDRRLYALAGLYAATLAANILFEHLLIINRRPVFEADGALEASYPSSHTLLAMTFLGGSLLLCRDWLLAHGHRKAARLSTILHLAAIILLIATRACAGVHWLTDIIGGVLLGQALLALFALERAPRNRN